MTHSAAALRLVLDELPDPAPPVPAPRAPAGPLCLEVSVDDQLNFLQNEIDGLQSEIRILRRRDDQINLFMDRIGQFVQNEA